MNINDFVFVKDNAFTDKFCDSLIFDFERYKQLGQGGIGESGAGINYDIKNTYDININNCINEVIK